ncbi:Pol polyprotein [Plakobranchus ocellatus]|uniref:Pol polyprotein n=1 Tax=Plakobranchus ocellatus TaxID=259542 RepID=A0AAV4DAW9_9GAST|nr:Pol polyprotein [Plakobranchus ocellatus]
MENLGITRKSISPYSSPVFMVKKRDGSNRICIDYSELNKITVFEPHLMLPADVFQGLENDRYFSKIDLGKGFQQIPVRPEDILRTSFVLMNRHHEFLRITFWMMNSGATHTRAVKMLVRGINHEVDYVGDL